MITAKRVDSNQQTIIDGFRKLGYSVISLHEVAHGTPDLLIAKNGLMSLVEIKTEKGKLNDLQKQFAATWNAEVYIVRDIDDIIKLDKALLEPIKNNRERY